MKSILSLILTLGFLASANAKVYNFISCANEPEVTQEVRELLSEPKRPGYAHHVGFYEFKKQGHVVGYLPFYYQRDGRQTTGDAYMCSNHWDNNYYNHAESLKDWTPNMGQTFKSDSLHNDEAVSHLVLTRISQTEVSIDVFIRSLGGGNDVVKDVITLSLVPKYKL